MKPLKTLLFSALLSPLLGPVLGCGSNGNTSPIDIPIMDLECQQTQAGDCSITGDNRDFHVGLIAGNTGADCAQVITAAGTDFYTGFRASGTVSSSLDSTKLVGSVTDWVDGDNQSATTIDSGTYTLCAYLDTNEDGLLSAGEPFARDVITLGQLSYVITDWQQN